MSGNTGAGWSDEDVERGARAINEQIPEWQLRHAAEGKPDAEEAIARAVLESVTPTGEREELVEALGESLEGWQKVARRSSGVDAKAEGAEGTPKVDLP